MVLLRPLEDIETSLLVLPVEEAISNCRNGSVLLGLFTETRLTRGSCWGATLAGEK